MSNQKDEENENQSTNIQLTVSKLQVAEKVILQGVQYEALSKELEVLQNITKSGEELSRSKAKKMKDKMKRTSSLYRLDPFLNENGI